MNVLETKKWANSHIADVLSRPEMFATCPEALDAQIYTILLLKDHLSNNKTEYAKMYAAYNRYGNMPIYNHEPMTVGEYAKHIEGFTDLYS